MRLELPPRGRYRVHLSVGLGEAKGHSKVTRLLEGRAG